MFLMFAAFSLLPSISVDGLEQICERHTSQSGYEAGFEKCTEIHEVWVQSGSPAPTAQSREFLKMSGPESHDRDKVVVRFSHRGQFVAPK